MTEVKIGTVVRSKAGRDKGDLFIVLRTEDNYAYIANGILRKVERPKKKKLMHLQPSGYVSPLIAERLEAAGEVENFEVRKALAEYSEN